MAVQLAFSLSVQDGQTLAQELRDLASLWGNQTMAPAHADASAAITARHFAVWAERSLSGPERKRVEAYFRGVLRRRIISNADVSAVEARSRLIARSIEQDLVQAGWDQSRAAHQACVAAGIALSA